MFTGTLRKSAVLFLLVLLVSLLAGCNEPIPNSDLQEAKQAIAIAEAAKAAQYDPDNLQAAKDSYGKALKMVVEDENAAARKLALEAKQKADLATENSRRKLAEATIKEAEELLVKADQQRASFLAAAQYREAQTKLDDAKRAFPRANMSRPIPMPKIPKRLPAKPSTRPTRRWPPSTRPTAMPIWP
jgi:hypothetical protein